MTQEKAIANCCCPFLNINECYDTDEHCHPICEVLDDIIPNEVVITQCVSDHKWLGCVHFAVEIVQEGKYQ